MPYDRFVLYQLAADRIAGAEPRHLAALGFLSLGPGVPQELSRNGRRSHRCGCARDAGLDGRLRALPRPQVRSDSDQGLLLVLFDLVQYPRSPRNCRCSASRPSSRRSRSCTRADSSAFDKDYQEYRLRRNAEMVAFFKTQTADYLLAAHDAETLGNTEIEELVRDRQLNQHVLARWRKYLRESKASGEPVFRLWHAAAAIPDKEFAARWPTTRGALRVPALVETELNGKAISSLRDLAVAYAAVLAQIRSRGAFRRSGAPNSSALCFAVRRRRSDVPLEEFELICTEGDSNNTRSIRVRYNAMLAQAAYDGAPPRAMAVEDLPHPVPGHVFIRGNPNNPGALTPPRFLSLSGRRDDKPFRDGSGRLELAQRHHRPGQSADRARDRQSRLDASFRFGMVRTPSDFGFRGDPPTHPELLDYLAVKFVESGWSFKKLHRLIMTSAAYRQASADNEAARKLDPENQLLWRMNRRRLEIESRSRFHAGRRRAAGPHGGRRSVPADRASPRRLAVRSTALSSADAFRLC